MCRELIHIYGPFSIQAYGLMMFIGLITIVVLMSRDRLRKKIMANTQLYDSIAIGVFSGVIGARLLYLFCNFSTIASFLEFFAVWDGGLSLIGAIVGILCGLSFYLWYKNISILLFFDLLALYVPLLQAIGRIGCFFAGCCYGYPTDLPWGISYSEFSHRLLHPTQLYSSILLFLIFFFLLFFRKKWYCKSGQLLLIYLVLASSERFFVDFFRGDREFLRYKELSFLSIHQYFALFIIGMAMIGLIILYKRSVDSHEHI